MAAPMERGGELSDRYRLLWPSEVLAIFASKEEGLARCAQASAIWEAHDAEIRKAEAARDAAVLAALKGD